MVLEDNSKQIFSKCEFLAKCQRNRSYEGISRYSWQRFIHWKQAIFFLILFVANQKASIRVRSVKFFAYLYFNLFLFDFLRFLALFSSFASLSLSKCFALTALGVIFTRLIPLASFSASKQEYSNSISYLHFCFLFQFFKYDFPKKMRIKF